MARREERAYREYVSDEQRSQAGCIGVQSATFTRGRVLNLNRRDEHGEVVASRRPHACACAKRSRSDVVTLTS